MAHSNRLSIHCLFVAAEIVLALAAIATAYLSAVGEWSGFLSVSAASVVLFSIVKIFNATPRARELIVQEDLAAKIAPSAERYGVTDYFNMQSASDQARRNDSTQQEIKRARSLWLCANSGASYLDSGIYRHWPFIKKQLDTGGNFRVVLLDPFCEEKSFRNQINTNGEALDSKINLANLIKLHNAFPSLEIRFAKQGMHATVFATEHALFFDPYQVGVINGQIENRSFSMKIEYSDPLEGVGLYRLFKAHFDTLWQSGTPFADWMVRVQPQLPAGLPPLQMRQ